MIIFQDISAYFILICFAYLVGSINFSIIIYHIIKNGDIRNLGSKNAGATNIARFLGTKIGILVMFLDILKSVSVMFTSIALKENVNFFHNANHLEVIAVFILIGHCYPVFYNFRGGKGAACALGIVLSLNWVLFLIALFLVFAIVVITKYVSVASLATTWIIFILSWIPWLNHGPETPYVIVGDNAFIYWPLAIAIISLFMTFKHRVNIMKLISGKESKIYLFKKMKKQKQINNI